MPREKVQRQYVTCVQQLDILRQGLVQAEQMRLGVERHPDILQTELQDQLAEKLLSGEILDGSVVPVTVADGGLAVGFPATQPAAVVH